MNVMKADRDVVKRLQEQLTRAFEQFALEMVDNDPSGEGLRYVDALMGCHNFYRRVILDLEERTQHQALPGVIRQIAVDTLRHGLGR